MILRNNTAYNAYEITLPLSLSSCYPLNLAILITVSAPKVKYVHVIHFTVHIMTLAMSCVAVLLTLLPVQHFVFMMLEWFCSSVSSVHILSLPHTDARPPEVRYTLNKIWLQPTANLSGPCAHNSQGVAKSGNILKSWRHLLWSMSYPLSKSSFWFVHIVIFSHSWHLPSYYHLTHSFGCGTGLQLIQSSW